MSVWYFERRDNYGVFTTPKHDEHFSHVRGIVDSVVREVLQNSGDANDANTGKPVHVKMRFGKIDEARLQTYLPGLSEHLDPFNGLKQLLTSNRFVPFLVIEDFETHGLRGSYDPSAPVVDSSYISFWHRYGESGKGNEHGGRHGLGKSTIASASRLRLFFGASVSSETQPRQVLLQGQICLAPHTYKLPDGTDAFFDSYGLWYNQKTKTKKLPFIDREAASFMHDFNLERDRRPGLSLVIPFPHEEISKESLIRTIIENSFHQILSRQMVVEIEDVTLDAQSIKSVARQAGIATLDSAMALSASAAAGKQEIFRPRANASAAQLSEDHFSASDLRKMRARWTDGKIVAVSLPVVVRKKKGPQEEGEVRLYVKREQNEALAHETYIRGRVSVPQRLLAGSNCVALMVADTGIASTFLGDAEPPAHDRWLRLRLSEKYKNPAEALNRIKFGLRDLVGIIDSSKDEKAIKDAFSEYLWAPKIADVEHDPRPTPPAKPVSEVSSIPAVAQTMPHILTRIEGGFAYTYRGDDNQQDQPLAWARIHASYRRRATKVSSTARFRDFEDGIDVDEDGTGRLDQVTEARRLIFNLTDVAQGYHLRVTGFDLNRDIELKMEAGING